jgi:hypothetical protein
MTDTKSSESRPKLPRPKPQLKPKSRPSAAAFRASAEKLDLINSLAPHRRVPAIIDLSSDSKGAGEELTTEQPR